MNNDLITIDIDRLRSDIREECMGAAFGGGFCGALVESFDIEKVPDERLIEIALQKGIDISLYMV